VQRRRKNVDGMWSDKQNLATCCSHSFARYGTVASIEIPRPKEGIEKGDGVVRQRLLYALAF
jgi:hypothetical protein